jgi:hypothetical protein
LRSNTFPRVFRVSGLSSITKTVLPLPALVSGCLTDGSLAAACVRGR